MQKTINGAVFTKMIISASKNLDVNRQNIDALNVFPVPDGDTGTNMSLTMQAAVAALKECKSNNLNDLASAVSRGALRGARGNSGVILSQIFRGLCTVIKSVNEIDTKVFTKAAVSATKTAYSAVPKPQEGTILTICRAISEAFEEKGSKIRDFEKLMPEIITAAEEMLKRTPEMLPVLRKAGVVDAGGMGLLTVYRGMLKGLLNEEIEGAAEEVAVQKTEASMEHADILGLGTIEFGYCTEFFIINLKKRTTLADIDKLREQLMTIGDCVLVIGDLEFVKVHVHTNNPGQAITKALMLGEVDKVKIENMLEQNRALIRKIEEEKKEMGMLAVCAGEGLSAIFKDLNVDHIIEGGQTMNPSASDIADAVMRINASNVFVFPNNKNIILAAEQAKALVKNRTIHVIPTKNIPQGFSAALAFNSELPVDENKINMLHAIDNVTVGQVTYAVRTTKIDKFSLKVGDIIALDSKKILAKGTKVDDVTVKLIEIMSSGCELINLYYGQDVKAEEAEQLQARLQELYPDCDVEIFYGGQPIYYYFVSFE